MNNKLIHGIMLFSSMLGVASVYADKFSNDVYADEVVNQTIKSSDKTYLQRKIDSITDNNKDGFADINRNVLSVKLFKEKNYTNPLGSGKTTKGMKIESELLSDTEVHSAVFEGFIQLKQASTSGVLEVNIPNALSKITINNENVTKKEMTLLKDEKIPIRIEIQLDKPTKLSTLNNISVQVKKKDSSVEKISDQSFLPIEKRDTLMQSKNNPEPTDLEPEEDNDDDNILNGMEENGYTVIDSLAVDWKDEYAAQGFTKFVSNPLRTSTTGDPYTDFEHANGYYDMPLGNDHSTINPLVAAMPSVEADLEHVIISPNKDLSNGVDSSYSESVAEESSWGIGTGIEGNKHGPSIEVNANYSSSTTRTIENSWSENSSESFNTASAAYMNANIRYRNTGTGVISSVTPTMNFVVGKDTIRTIKGNEQFSALRLDGQNSRNEENSTYPKKGQNGIAITDATTQEPGPIELNETQTKTVTQNKDAITLETTQTEGNYLGLVNGIVAEAGAWSGYEGQVKNNTAAINFVTKDGKPHKQWISGVNYSDPNNARTPRVTLKEALKILEEQISDPLLNGESFVQIVTNEKTEEMMMNQINATTGEFANVNTPNDVILESGMNITLLQPEFGTDVDTAGDWGNSIKQDYGHNSSKSIQISAGNNNTELKILNDGEDVLKTMTNYVYSFWASNIENDSESKVKAILKDKNNAVMKEVEITIPKKNTWEKVNLVAMITPHQKVSKIEFTSLDGKPLNFAIDDIAVKKWSSQNISIVSINQWKKALKVIPGIVSSEKTDTMDIGNSETNYAYYKNFEGFEIPTIENLNYESLGEYPLQIVGYSGSSSYYIKQDDRNDLKGFHAYTLEWATGLEVHDDHNSSNDPGNGNITYKQKNKINLPLNLDGSKVMWNDSLGMMPSSMRAGKMYWNTMYGILYGTNHYDAKLNLVLGGGFPVDVILAAPFN